MTQVHELIEASGLFLAQEVFAEHEKKGKSTKSPTEIVKAYFDAFLKGDVHGSDINLYFKWA